MREDDKFYLWFFEFEEAVEHSGEDVNLLFGSMGVELKKEIRITGQIGVELKLY